MVLNKRPGAATGFGHGFLAGFARRLGNGLVIAMLFVGIHGSASAQGEVSGDWVISPVNVIDVTDGTVLENRAVFVADGRIVDIEAAGLSRDGFVPVDGAGGWLIPALAEMHAHVPAGSRGQQATEDVLTMFLAHGITTIRGMLGEPSHLELRDALATGTIFGPRLITSGPSFNGSSVSSPEQGAARVLAQADAGYDFLKIHPGLSREEFLAISTAASTMGMPFGGHISFETGLDTALQQGQDTIDHLDGYAEAMVPPSSPLSGQAPEWFGLNLAAGIDPSLAPALARATAAVDVWNVPTQSLFETTTGTLSVEQLLKRPGMDLIEKSVRDNWAEAVENIRAQSTPEERQQFLAARNALILALQKAGAPLLLGSDAPQIFNVPGVSTHQELAYLVEAGLTPLQALQSGTLNVAKFFQEADRGTIAVGQVADLLLLAANPLENIHNSTRILGVSRDGQWYDEADLQQRLAAIRERLR